MVENKTYAIKDMHAKATGTPADAGSDKLEELNKAAHAKCGTDPCAACRLHGVATGTEAAADSENKDGAGVHDRQASNTALTGLTLRQIQVVYHSMKEDVPTSTRTTQGRSVHTTPDTVAFRHKLLAHMYNDAGICKTCRKHWRECACEPDAETTHVHAMHDGANTAGEHIGMQAPQPPHARTHAPHEEKEGASGRGTYTLIL